MSDLRSVPPRREAPDALFADLYELTMMQAYVRHGLTGPAAFDVFVRRLPKGRGYLVACGLADVLEALESLAFSPDDLAYLRSLGYFGDDFLDYLAAWRFTGDVRAVPEGTTIFPGEPLLEIVAPLPEAQLVETLVINQIQLQTMLASKARRVVEAAAGRPVLEFGARRMHGTDAARKGARAMYVSGIEATSNLAAGRAYGIPVAGTMAHSYVQAREDEYEAFRAFADLYPHTTLLVDTYDTLDGVRNVVRLAGEMGDRFTVRAVRLDSGDLLDLSRAARQVLDAAGLGTVQIVASGGLDEWSVRDLVAAGAPIDAFGVGTAMGVSADAPSLDLVYKLVEYDGHGRTKRAASKSVVPFRKQLHRHYDASGRAVRDVITREGDAGAAGQPLLEPVMQGGRRTEAGRRPLAEIRTHAQRSYESLPEGLRDLDTPEAYPVDLSARLQEDYDRLLASLEA